MKNPEISVIVPVFNAEKYLCKCIDSILAQSFCNFELLLIDDGSIDNSSEICDDYAGKDKRIKVFHKTNEGISATREFGIQCAEGEYIQFVDSDDWINPDMLQEMWLEVKRTDADVVGCNFTEIYPTIEKKVKAYYDSKDQFLRAVLRNEWGVLWKIMFRRTLFLNNDIHFPKNINGGEDFFVVSSLLFYAPKVSCVNEFFYFYNRCNSSSLIAKQKTKDILQQIKATSLVEQLLVNNGCIEKYHDELLHRKYSCKSPLKYTHPLLWYRTFKESNVLRSGWKDAVVYFFCNQIDKII